MTDEELQTIEWLGLRFQVPRDWEIVRHGLSLKSGSLVFVDRRQQRMQLSWRGLAREPDLERMLADEQRRETEAEPTVTFEPLTKARGWQGFVRSSPSGESLTRAVRFDDRSARLMEAVIVTPAQAEHARLARRLLATLEVVQRPELATRWRAFDVSLVTPSHYRLVGANIKPGDVCFEFRAAPPGRRELGPELASIRRMGMAAAWYDGNPKQLIQRESPRVKFRGFEPTSRGPHPALVAEGDEPRQRWQRLIGRASVRRVAVWRCDDENAVYRVTTVSRSRRPVRPEEFRVTCCGAGSHG